MFYAIAVVLVLIADQALKYWVSLNIELNVGEQALIPGVIKLVNIHNSGAAFGLLSGGSWRWVFVVIAVVFTVVVIYALKRDLIHGKLGRWAAVGVLAGSIGNCIDRVAYGYVVDMFKFEFLGDSRLNAIFNVADVFISCCGILFCLYILFGHEYKTAKTEPDEYEDDRPVRSARTARSSGGSHAKSSGSHTRAAQSARTPAREARSERPVQEPRRENVSERTRIPVQQPRPQRRPTAQQVRSIDPNDPFAEWEQQRAPASSKPAEPVRPAAPRPARPAAQVKSEAAPEVRSEPAPRAPARSAEPAKPKKGEYEFTLEEILAEFSDK